MKLTLTAPEGPSYAVDMTLMLRDAMDENELAAMLLGRIANFASIRQVNVDDIGVLEIDGNEATGLTFRHDTSWDFTWVKEVAYLFWYLENKERDIEEGRVFARIEATDWRFVDFDDLKWEVEEGFRGDFPDDLEEWGRERLDDTGEDLPDHLRKYFDFEKYAQDELDEYEKCEWGDQTFLYDMNR